MVGKKKINEEIKIQSRDVFLVSYPRAGNTWLRYLLANLFHPDKEWHIANLNQAIPDLHQEVPKNYIESKPRIFKSHQPYCEDFSHVIYLCRDGRDVALSYYDLRKKKGFYKKGFQQFLIDMLKGEMPYGSWQNHIQSWLCRSHNSSFITISYERLCKETCSVIKLLGEFLGANWSEKDIKLAIQKSTFEKQKRDFFIYKYESHWAKGFRGGVKGAPGKWREVFTDEQNQLFWEYAGCICEKLGYSRY